MNQIVPSARVVADPLGDLSPWWPAPIPPSSVGPQVGPEASLAKALARGLVVFRSHNYPTEALVSAAKAWNPAASDLLDHWAEAWRRSFPDGLSEVVGDHRNEGGSALAEDWKERMAASEARCLSVGDRKGAASYRWRRFEAARSVPGERAWQAHVVDDAECVRALRGAVPGDAWIVLGRRMFALDRHDPDGVPILVRETARAASGVDDARRSCMDPDDHPYWRSPAFLAEARRRFAYAGNAHEAALILLAMAREGAGKAFLKGEGSKTGTWTADLAGVDGPESAMGALLRAVGATAAEKGLIVQDHMPFSCEQRFFVTGGRIVASVCSDRHLSAADRRPGRILDERVAELETPENDVGAYDRGTTRTRIDRTLAAAFARGARRLVRGLAAEGAFDYVLDMGLSTDGTVAPIELNSLHLAGPYCLDRDRFVRARARLATEAAARFRTSVAETAVRNLGTARGGVVAGSLASRRTVSSVLADFGPRVPEFADLAGGEPSRILARMVEAEHARLAGLELDAAGADAPAEALDALGHAAMRGSVPLFAADIRLGADGSRTGRFCLAAQAGPDGPCGHSAGSRSSTFAQTARAGSHRRWTLWAAVVVRGPGLVVVPFHRHASGEFVPAVSHPDEDVLAVVPPPGIDGDRDGILVFSDAVGRTARLSVSVAGKGRTEATLTVRTADGTVESASIAEVEAPADPSIGVSGSRSPHAGHSASRLGFGPQLLPRRWDEDDDFLARLLRPCEKGDPYEDSVHVFRPSADPRFPCPSPARRTLLSLFSVPFRVAGWEGRVHAIPLRDGAEGEAIGIAFVARQGNMRVSTFEGRKGSNGGVLTDLHAEKQLLRTIPAVPSRPEGRSDGVRILPARTGWGEVDVLPVDTGFLVVPEGSIARSFRVDGFRDPSFALLDPHGIPVGTGIRLRG